MRLTMEQARVVPYAGTWIEILQTQYFSFHLFVVLLAEILV